MIVHTIWTKFVDLSAKSYETHKQHNNEKNIIGQFSEGGHLL